MSPMLLNLLAVALVALIATAATLCAVSASVLALRLLADVSAIVAARRGRAGGPPPSTVGRVIE